jgi:phosphatidylglycerophosphatase A
VTGAGGSYWRELLISGLGSGFLPFAPGSWGSLYAALLFGAAWGALAWAGGPRWAVEALTAAGIAAAGCGSVAWGAWAIARFGRKDPRQFTLDEFAGQWVALVGLPLALGAAAGPVLLVIGGQFVLFRLFDVSKPPPARQLERLPAGWGVLCDDLAAGVYANVAGQLVWRLTPLAAWLS